MPDESDPPRKHYQLKPKEFESVNHPPREGAASPGISGTPDSGPGEADHGRIDVREIFRQANRPGKALQKNASGREENEVHAMLRENLARADAAGLNEVAPVKVFHRRKRDFIVLLILGNGFIAVVYAIELVIGFQVQCLAARMPFEFWNLMRSAFTNPAVFALPVAGMVFFSAAVAWLMYGMMDDY